jgi:catechol 2,3-dioxygenase-like lactoylglutathione lyase family enzyme
MNLRQILASTIFAVALFSSAVPASAQLAAPNSMGISMGHVHLLVKDPDAQTKFFTTLGGVPVANGTLQLIQFPGVYIMLRKGDPSDGSVGSIVNHFGFHVKSVADTLAKIKPLIDQSGYKVEQNNPQQAFVTEADGVRVELLEDPKIAGLIEMHHVHLFVTAPTDVQAWYVKTFGAVASKRGAFDTANLPGVEMAFSKNDAAQAPTKGRSIDHIGYEVKNLEGFLKNLEAQGIKIDVPMRVVGSGTKIAFITDPWGTYIELTQGLAPSLSAAK